MPSRINYGILYSKLFSSSFTFFYRYYRNRKTFTVVDGVLLHNGRPVTVNRYSMALPFQGGLHHQQQHPQQLEHQEQDQQSFEQADLNRQSFDQSELDPQTLEQISRLETMQSDFDDLS